MAIRVVCPTCAKNLTAPDAAAGKSAPCPACKTKILVPAAAAEVKPAEPTGAKSPPAAPSKPAATPTSSAPKTSSAAPISGQPKAPARPAATNAKPPKPAQPVARPAAAATSPAAQPNPAAPPKPTAQPQRTPPPPPAPVATPAIKPKAPLANDDDLVDLGDIEMVDEYGISPTPLPAVRPAEPRPLVNVAKGTPISSAERDLKGARSRSVSQRLAPDHARAGGRRFLYFALILAMIPLALSLIGDDHSVEERLARTQESHPDAFNSALDGTFDPDEFFAKLPDHKLLGAHLSKESWAHWLYAFISAGVFLAVAMFLFEKGTANSKQLLGVGATTATLGIISLLLIQLAASLTNGYLFRGNIAIMIAFYILKFIAFSYQCASDPSNGFILSFFGYTFGVGLCEELVKAAPVLLRMRSPKGIDWRGACVWGLASGVGFGVAEGIMYSSDSYNGVHTFGVYLVRFVSCVALHAVWSAAVGITIWHQRKKLAGDLDWKELTLVVLIALAGPMTLHGLYDTMLKRDMAVWALVTALASFGWLAGLIEWTRYQEANEAPPPKKALRSIRVHQSPMLPSE